MATIDTVIPHVLLPVLLFLAFYLPSFRHRGPIFSTLIVATVAACSLDDFPHDRTMRYAMNAAWIFYFPALEKLLLRDNQIHGGGLEHEFWRVGGAGVPHEAERMPSFSWAKARWAAALLASPRAVGWSHGRRGSGSGSRNSKATAENSDAVRAGKAGPKGPFETPPTPSQRALFVCRQALLALLGLVAIEAATLLASPSASPWGMLPPRTVAGVVLAELLMCATVWGSWIAQYGTVAALGVGLGLSGPGDWPPIFGSPADADSVAGFWGRFWPGILRQPALGFSHYFLELLGIGRGTSAAHAVHLVTAFGFSALFHIVSIYPVSRGYVPTAKMCADISLFFASQAAAILFETAVMGRYRRIARGSQQNPDDNRQSFASRKRPAARWVGYLWALTWLGLSSWPFVRTYLAVGAMEWKAPVPIVEPCLEYLRMVWFGRHHLASAVYS